MRQTAMVIVVLVLLGSSARAGGPTASAPAHLPPSDTVLGKLVASTKPGTFAILNQHGDGSGYSSDLVDGVRNGKGVGSIFGYAHKAAYDPVSDSVYFVGQAHDGATEMVRYRVSANTWANVPVPPAFWRGHAQDTNTINSAARELYVGAHVQSTNMRRFNLETQTWSTMTQPLSAGVPNGDPSADYFPERKELLYVGGKHMAAWTRATNTWKSVGRLPALGQRAPIARYSPVHRCVLVMGGADTHITPTRFSHAVYVYRKDGTIARLHDSPDSIKIYIGSCLMAADPVSGDYILIQGVYNKKGTGFTRDIELWTFSIATDKWTQLDKTVVPKGWWWREGWPFAVVAAPISTYGVIMYMSAARANSSVYVYKHAQRPTREKRQ